MRYKFDMKIYDHQYNSFKKWFQEEINNNPYVDQKSTVDILIKMIA